MARTTDERLDCLMEQLEKGTQNIFESGRYAEYLAVMSKFHHYSFRNTILIFLQNPNASHVAGFHAWKKDFGRSVKAGEHGIQILAPCPKRKWMDHDKIDPATGLPVKDENGNTMQERTIITIPRYRVVTVFDVSQTEGKELPSLGVAELYGDVPNYQCIYDRLVAFSPVPVSIEPIAQSGAKGYFSDREQRIVLRSGMSEVQTVKTLMHEIAHAVLHNAERLQETGKRHAVKRKSRRKASPTLSADISASMCPITPSAMLRAGAGVRSYENCMRRSTPSAKLPRRSLMQLRYPRESMSESKNI